MPRSRLHAARRTRKPQEPDDKALPGYAAQASKSAAPPSEYVGVVVTTASRLESMTDRSRFELLATSVLRKADATYAAVIHTGVNADGETVVAPLDGLHLVPRSSPPHYVFVQHTTTERSRLRGKWLTNREADFGKAVRVARDVRRDQPDAQFTVVLCTNQRTQCDLVLDISKEASAEGVALDIWEQSRISDFLDSTRDGHWLRKIYLGVEAERLSEELLHHLCVTSVEAYRRNLHISEEDILVRRTVLEEIEHTVDSGETQLCLLLGASGFGKSVACMQAMQRRRATGRLSIWLPAEYLRDSVLIEEALDAWLRTLHPSLELDAGRIALDLSAKLGRLMVVVDDVNREDEPAHALHVLFATAVPLSERRTNDIRSAQADDEPTGARILVVVPVWPEHLQHMPRSVVENRSVRLLSVGEMATDACCQIIRGAAAQLSHLSASEFADRLGRDPFLIGLFASVIDHNTAQQDMVAIADDVVGQFLDQQTNTLADSGFEALLPSEVRRILVKLAQEMLLRRDLRPSWHDVRDWFGHTSEEILGLRGLVQQGHVCRIDAEERIAFRHDRIQERLLVDAMDGLLRVAQPPEDVISDPFFARLVGKAIMRDGHREDWPQRLRSSAPLTLFEAIRHFDEPTTKHQRNILAQVDDWAQHDSRRAPKALVGAVSWTLLETESHAARRIVDALEPNPVLMLAGFRNGSARHGLSYMKAHLKMGFEPGMGDRLRDRIVAHVAHHNSPRLLEELDAVAQSSDVAWEDAAAFLALIGHLGLAGFEESINSLWRVSPDRLVGYGIWAASRCPVSDVGPLLDPMLDHLAGMPEREKSHEAPSEREYTALYLSWAFRRGMTEESIQFLLARARRAQRSLRRQILLMIESADDPDVMEFLVYQMVSQYASRRWERASCFSDADPESISLRPESRDRLRRLWDSDREPRQVRVQAFSIWLIATSCTDTALLRLIPEKSPLFQSALQQRVKLGDLSAAEDLLVQLTSNALGGFWWMVAHRVWCETLREHAASALAGLKGCIPTDFSGGRTDLEYFLADLLVMIPPDEAESLLETNWDDLMYSHLLLHAALRIGTPRCLEMAKKSMAACPMNVRIFKTAFFVWERGHASNPLTIQHLENLLPYLARMTEDEAYSLALTAERIPDSGGKIARWIVQHLVPRLSPERRASISVADEHLIRELDRWRDEAKTRKRLPDLAYLFERLSGRRGLRERQLSIIDEWLARNRTVHGFMVAAACLSNIGTRRHLDLLDSYSIEGEAEVVEKIATDTKFSVRRRTLQ